MTNSRGRDDDPEQVAFISHHLPGLAAGEYELAVAQQVEDSSGASIASDALQATYRFAVRSDRFRLKNPPDVIYGFFPADNATGEFSAVLPHVTFARRTFPWSRFLSPSDATLDPSLDRATWLAVLLVDQDDPATPLSAATIGDLFPPGVFPASTLGSGYSYFWRAKDASVLEGGEALADPIQILDVPLSLFWQIAPTAADLQLLAHARRVSLLQKPSSSGVADRGEPIGDFSIVFGARLPQTQRKSRAFLVSLEGLAPFLPTDPNGGAPNGERFDKNARLRLAVLASWTFFSTGEAAAFTDRLLALDLSINRDASLSLPYAGDDVTLRKSLAAGYAPINHDLRDGGRTVSWYRGPLAPYPTAKREFGATISSPDQASAFDPTTGMFDVSYGAAWTLGRLLALQDSGFSAAFLRWRQSVTREAAQAIEDQILRERLGSLLGPPQETLTGGAVITPSLLRATLNRLAETSP